MSDANVLARLSNVDVLDLEGRAVRLGDVLAGRPTVLVFVRHFG